MYEAEVPHNSGGRYEANDAVRERVNKELDEYEKDNKNKELKLKAKNDEQVALIRSLATKRGFTSMVKKSYFFPKDIIIKKFHSNVKCISLHEIEIKKYCEEDNGKEDLRTADYIPNILERKDDNRQVKRNPILWKDRYNERLEKGLFSLPSSAKGLPIIKYTEQIISRIKSNRVLIISGETGCGKSTQVPQMILNDKELGPEACIICCQPRRLCAVGLAERVAEERGEKVGETVSYSIRFDSKLNEKTQLEYVTTGLLLRRLNNDPKLEGITHLIIDEAHERDQFLDFLLVYVKDKLLKLNPKIHIIIMSATLQIEKISKYFDDPSMIKCEGKMFPIKEYWLDEIKEMIKDDTTNTTTETRQDDENDGDNNDDINGKSNEPLPPREDTNAKKDDNDEIDDDDNDLSIDNNLIVDVCKYIICNTDSTEEDAILIFLPGWGEILDLEEKLKKDIICETCNILPLHSNLSNKEQSKVFKKASEGKEEDNSNSRKIIISTNVAETSLTIDEVRYVIDVGLMKVNKFDSQTKITSLTTELVSQANVRQRTGRAGRTKEGECYHLYTKEKQNRMKEYPVPEIQRIVLDEVILRTRAIDRGCIYRISDFLSKLLDPPDIEMIDNGIELLQSYGALNRDESLTKIGEYLNDIPILPKYSYLLLLAVFFRCYESVLAIVCILNVNDIFKNASKKKEKEKIKNFKRENCKTPNDFIFLLQTYSRLQFQDERISKEECKKNKILFKKIEIEMMNNISNSMIKAKIFTKDDLRIISENKDNFDLVTQVIAMALFPHVGVHIKNSNIFMFNEEAGGYSHPSSVVSLFRDFGDTELLIFDEVNRDNRDRIYFQYAAIVHPLTVLLCSPYNFEPTVIKKDDSVIVKLSEKFRMTVNKDYYEYIKYIKKKMRFLFHIYINNPSDLIGSDKYRDFFELVKEISKIK